MPAHLRAMDRSVAVRLPIAFACAHAIKRSGVIVLLALGLLGPAAVSAQARSPQAAGTPAEAQLEAPAKAGDAAAGTSVATVTAQAAAQSGDDPLTAALAAEYALQAGKLDEAAAWYLRAAQAAPGDAALAERAARAALLAKDDDRAADALKLWRARAGDSVPLRAAEASLALRRGQLRTGTRLLQGMLREDLDRAGEQGWRYALRALDAASGDPEIAGRALERLIAPKRMPDDFGAWLGFADMAERLRRDDLVETLMTQIIARYPDEPAARLLQASQLRESGKPDAARAVLDGLLQSDLNPGLADRVELKIAIAREFAELGDRARAEALLAQGPQSDRLYGIRAAFLAQAEDKAALGRLYDELRQVSASPARRLLLGQIAEFLERREEALEWYAGVPGGEQRRTARLRSVAVLHKLGRREEAYARLRALQTDATLDEDSRRDAYLFEADLYKEDGRLDAELDAYARGLDAFPDDPVLIYARALMWERRDDIPRAEADFRRILAIDPDDTNALNALGYTLTDRTDRHQEALELIARALAAEPDNAAIIDSYGWVLYRLGRHKEALVELRRAFTKQKDAEIGAHVAEVLWVLGRREEALRYFEEARKIDPESRSLLRALEVTGAVLPPLPPKAEDAPTGAGSAPEAGNAAEAGADAGADADADAGSADTGRASPPTSAGDMP